MIALDVVLPDEVNDTVLANYRACLDQTELACRPQDIHRALCIAWNRAVDQIPKWPRNRVNVPAYKQSYVLDWESFPASLRQDVENYLDYLAGKDVLNSPPEPLRPASLKNVRFSLTLEPYVANLAGPILDAHWRNSGVSAKYPEQMRITVFDV